MTKIEWTKETWNPVVGCNKASPGCTNCYALPIANDRHPLEYARGGTLHSAKSKADGQQFVRVGKKAAGALLDGREWREVPG